MLPEGLLGEQMNIRAVCPSQAESIASVSIEKSSRSITVLNSTSLVAAATEYIP